MTTTTFTACDALVIGAGPAGLMAAERLAQAGRSVHVFDAMPSVGRKFLLAGKGGLNLTHCEPFDDFVSRFGSRRPWLEPLLRTFGADAVRDWAQRLGVDTFIGSSGRVFPSDMKAAPLLRAWLQRLRALGVVFHMRQRWLGWTSQGALRFISTTAPTTASATMQASEQHIKASATVLALGGASWPHLGSNGAWLEILTEKSIPIAPLQPANCGFEVWHHDAIVGQHTTGWSPLFTQRFAGHAFKSVAISFTDSQGRSFARQGEFVATSTGVEGSLIYAVSHLLRDEIAAHGHATWFLDLLPQHSAQRVQSEVSHPRGARSLASHLKGRLGIEGIKAAILYEQLGKSGVHTATPLQLAHVIKALPITVHAPCPIARAISTAGGVMFEALSDQLMLRAMPGVFCAGEMLDWEAPTGGYLLTACFSSGYAAGEGAAQWLRGMA